MEIIFRTIKFLLEVEQALSRAGDFPIIGLHVSWRNAGLITSTARA
jgi:hypothetical protein